MVLEKGEKVHVIERRMFENDVRRHFVGEVKDVDGILARIVGRAFIYDLAKAEYTRKTETRTRIYSLADGRLVINVLPADTDLESVTYARLDNRLVVTDNKGFQLDINEFGPRW